MEGRVHAVDLADHFDAIARRELLLLLRDDAVYVAGHGAEIAALSVGEDLVDGLYVGLVQVCRGGVALERRDIAQQRGHRATASGRKGADRRVPELIQRALQMLRRLHRQIIGYPSGGISPEIRRDLLRRA